MYQLNSNFQLFWFAIALIGLNVAKIDIRKVVSRVQSLQEYSTQVSIPRNNIRIYTGIEENNFRKTIFIFRLYSLDGNLLLYAGLGYIDKSLVNHS